jgi:hypothetical protein
MIVPGLGAYFRDFEHRDFIPTQADFYHTYREIPEEQFRRLDIRSINLYYLYRLFMHAVYFLTNRDYNLLKYPDSARGFQSYDEEIMYVFTILQVAVRGYLLNAEIDLLLAARNITEPSSSRIRFHYTVKENEKHGEKPDAPACFACDREDDIEGKWLFTVSYKLNGKDYTHYYDYDSIIKGSLATQDKMRHPILMGDHQINLKKIREIGEALGAPRPSHGGGRKERKTTKTKTLSKKRASS